MFCVECGKETPLFKNGICLNCYLKHTKFSKGPAILDIIMCPRCSAYKYKNTWQQESFPEILKRHVKDTFHISPELQSATIDSECKQQDKMFQCTVTISGYLSDQHITEQHQLTVRIRRSTCDMCSREAGGYFEAILQIRAEQRILTKTERDTLRSTVETLVAQFQESGKRGLFITDIDENRQGFDVFLSEKGTALAIAKKIQEHYGGDFKQSASIAGMKDSKQVYRMTYLVRLPCYRKGDFFSLDDTFFYITSIHGAKVRVIALSNWDEKVIDGKHIQPSKIIGGQELVKDMIVVSQSKTELQLMDPITYATIEIRKPRVMTVESSMVKTVKLDDQVFLFPTSTS